MAYSENLLERGNMLTRLAHRSRFKFALDILAGHPCHRALDYGCGDGRLLLELQRAGLCQAGTGVDFDEGMLVQARAGFSGVAHFDFCSVAEMEQKAPLGAFDLACCTETLEHVRNPGEILDQLIARLRPGGLLLVSVPIEIGPALLIKQAGRFVANRKRTYGYETYTLGELVLAGVLRDTESFPNSHNGGEGLGNPMTGHRGFDFRKVEKLVRDRAEVERTLFSPVPMLGPAFNSTVLWLARRGSCP